MNEWQNLALAVLLVVMAEIANEITIAVFRVRNATTRFRIRLISLLSCFFVFLVLPLKMIELIIPSGKSLITEEYTSLYIGPAMLTSRLSRFAWISIILVIIAVLCFTVMLLFSKVVVSRLLQCEPATDPHLLALVEEVSSELGVNVKEIMICKTKCDAFVYGYPPSLAVGEGLLEMLNEEELRIVIRHELYHVKGKDTLMKPLVTALCILFLYNPMMWFLSRKLAADRECCADQAAVTSSQDTKTFLSLLLKFHDVTKTPHSLAVHWLDSTTVRWLGSTSHIDSIFSTEKTRKIPVLVCLFLTFSSLFVGGTHLVEERCVEIERSYSFNSALYNAQVADVSVYFVDIPLVEWYQNQNQNQEMRDSRVGIPLQESELLELLKACQYQDGGITIRLAALPLWRRRQLFDTADVDFDADCHLIINTDAEGHLYASIEGNSSLFMEEVAT
jgi:beta-lactamase regulating signal transducer with metallopeptidase domain